MKWLKRCLVFMMMLSLLVLPAPEAAQAAAQKYTNTKLSTRTLKRGKKLKIHYRLAVKANLTIKIIDSKGRLAASYTLKKVPAKRQQTFTWNGKATAGNQMGLKKNAHVPGGQYKAILTSKGVKKTLSFKVKVPVSKVKLKPTKLTLTVGEKQTLKATVTPAASTNKAVTWKSSKPKVASVNSKGVVTAKSAGTAKITVTTKDGKKTDTLTVTVKKAAATPKPTATPRPAPKPTPTPVQEPSIAFTAGSPTTEYLYQNGFFYGSRVYYNLVVTNPAGLTEITIHEQASGAPNGNAKSISNTRTVKLVPGQTVYPLSQEMWNGNPYYADRYSGYTYTVSAHGKQYSVRYTGSYNAYNGQWSHYFGL